LPDSAIDLIDESSAKKRTSSIDLKIYKKLNKKKDILKKITKEKEDLVASDRYEKAILIRDKEQKLKKEITILRSKIQKIEKNNPVQLKSDDIIKTVAEATKIPLELLSEKTASIPDQAKKLLNQKIVGQEKIIQEIYNTLLRRCSGISNPDQPLGSFLFIGASGVGKTLTAKTLADSLSSAHSNNLIQINMSEFMEKHSISKFLGAPAGYVGYDEDKSLVEKIRQNPYSVVLFDEVEKADRNILNILLQILDEGKITDSKGRLINFKNTLIILTSNIGTSELNQLSKLGFSTEDKGLRNKTKLVKKEVEKKLQESLSPELLNRLDNILIFNHLSLRDLRKIAEKEIVSLEKRLKNKKINITIPNKKIASFIVDKKISPDQGARLIKKSLEKNLETLIAEKIIQNNSKNIKVSIEKNKIIVK
jgi:ATP-dependent Clp protease ATP-binding subunit ClpC